MTLRHEQELEEIEIELLIEGLYRRYGIDLRLYERETLRRRIFECMRQEQARTISGLQDMALHDPECLERLMLSLATHGGQGETIFGAPTFYSVFREKVIPKLRTYPFLRIWLAACSTGEEVYSMAIALQEEGLYQRSRIYATEISQEAVKRAKAGVFPLSEAAQYTSNYLRSGGRRYFSDYFATHNGKIFFDSSLKRNVTFLEHNLATDGSFNEFHVIICRNVMTDFRLELQERVHELIYDSLIVFGIVAIGSHESFRNSPREAFYEALDEKNRIYRKVL